jgi:hypothetical protein
MGWSTGIELGPDSCVLVSARQGKGTIDVSAARVLDASVWPSHDITITSTLKKLRRSERLPRNAALIVWGLPDDSPGDEVSGPAAMRPIAAAGFRIARVLSPAQALAELARTRPRPDGNAAVAWMALNTWGAAIAIVRSGDVLFARTLDWIYRPGLTESRAQLLQRYSLVAHIAPELQRGIAIVRQQHGANVTAAVTCGDLPELRSLTMPLIEELDLEVETLDTADGLTPRGRVKEAFGDVAPSLRLAAAAAATAPRSRLSLDGPLKAAAAVAVVGLVIWQALSFFSPRRPEPAQPTASAPAPAPRAAENRAAQAPPPAAPAPETRATPPVEPPAETRTPPVETRTSPVETRPAPAATRLPPPVKPLPPPPSSTPPVQPQPEPPPPVRPDPGPEPRTERPPAALKDPLPHLDSILIDATRRLAIVDGKIVRVGDRVGPRVVVQIENEAIVLREPSGLEVRVGLRDKSASGLPTRPPVL